MQGWSEVESVLNRVVWCDLAEVMTSENRLEGGERTAMYLFTSSGSRKRKRLIERPRGRSVVPCSRDIKDTSVAGEE